MASKMSVRKDTCHVGLYLEKLYLQKEVAEFSRTEQLKTKCSPQNNVLSSSRKTRDNVVKPYIPTRSFIEMKRTLTDKMVVGLGTHSVFETAMTYHHTYGVPYIPGSAIKGCLRSYIIQEEFGGCEEKALSDDYFVFVFGGMRERIAYQGNVTFLDAFPTSFNEGLDIMTPHYTKEYKDNNEPTPITFIVVEEAIFHFVLLINLRHSKQLPEHLDKRVKGLEGLKEKVAISFDGMLREHGIGAKGSLGYGYFTAIGSREKLLDHVRQLVDERCNKARELQIKEDKRIQARKEKQKLDSMTPVDKFYYELDKTSSENIKSYLEKCFREVDENDSELLRVIAQKLKEVYKKNKEFKIFPKKNKSKHNKKIYRVCDVLGEDYPN
ncbi:type III-B CRISPR module RAMP protein Cmr6 [Fusibacter sp. JL298sf-3]